MLLIRTGDYAAARPLIERGLAIREKVYGPDPGNVALISLEDLGILLYLGGDLAGAQPRLERAVHIREQVLGLQPPFAGTDDARTWGACAGISATTRPRGVLLERSVQDQGAGPARCPGRARSTSLSHLGILFMQMGD